MINHLTTCYTKEKFRLIPVQTSKEQAGDFNWLFLPGGPGLGSEYFESYLREVMLPGKLWRVDFPGDGSNRIDDEIDEAKWRSGLINIAIDVPNVILVTHSFSGMFVLTIPEIEDKLTALIIMDSAPNKDWISSLPERAKKYHLTDLRLLSKTYNGHKSDEDFKDFVLAKRLYFMSGRVEKEAKEIFSQLPYNYRTYDWAQKYFHPNYSACWAPQILPTLIMGGSDDVLTPIGLFRNDKRFQNEIISIKVIKNASHFPWVEQPKAVEKAWQQFAMSLVTITMQS